MRLEAKGCCDLPATSAAKRKVQMSAVCRDWRVECAVYVEPFGSHQDVEKRREGATWMYRERAQQACAEADALVCRLAHLLSVGKCR